MVVEHHWEAFYKPVCRCEVCGGEIYEGDYYYDFGDDVVCVECVMGYVRLNYEKKAEVK